jgi:hypothetical protein
MVEDTRGELVVPFAPDASDLPLRDSAVELAMIMGRCAPVAATFAALDQLFATVVAHVEVGLRGQGTAAELDITPDIRDRLLGDTPRAMFARSP